MNRLVVDIRIPGEMMQAIETILLLVTKEDYIQVITVNTGSDSSYSEKLLLAALVCYPVSTTAGRPGSAFTSQTCD